MRFAKVYFLLQFSEYVCASPSKAAAGVFLFSYVKFIVRIFIYIYKGLGAFVVLVVVVLIAI